MEQHPRNCEDALISEAIQFYKTVTSWFGQGGKPVSSDVAMKRALVCMRCPLNVDKPIWQLLADPVALTVRRQIELKSKLNLVLPDDEFLMTCYACNCMLKLKVWQPLEFIEENLTEEKTQKLHPSCWIISELKQEQCKTTDS